MADRLTDEEIARGLAACEAATAGPWRSTWDDPPVVARTPQDFVDAEIAVESTAPELTDTERRVVALVEYDGLNTSCSRENSAAIAHAGTHYATALRELARWRLAADEPRALASVTAETWRGWLAGHGWTRGGEWWLPPEDAPLYVCGFADRVLSMVPERALGHVAAQAGVPRAIVLVDLLALQESSDAR